MDALRKLVPYYTTTLVEARKNPFILNLLEQVETLDAEIFEKAKTRIAQPSYLQPETIGSYLFGCDLAYYGDVDATCSLFCLGSKGRQHTCNAQLWKLVNDNLTLLERNPSTHGMVYVDDFRGLSTDHLAQLSSHGIETLTFLDTQLGKHKIVYEKTPIYAVPTKLDVREGFLDQGENRSYGIWLLVLVVVLMGIWWLMK